MKAIADLVARFFRAIGAVSSFLNFISRRR